MRNSKKFVSILAGIMALILLLGLIASVIPSLVHAADELSSSEIEKQIEELEKEKAEIDKQIDAYEDKLSENLDEMTQIVEQKNLIDQEIFMLYEQIGNIEQQVAAYGVLIADKQDQLDAAEARFEELSLRNKDRIRAMEEEGELSYWSVLFQANSFSDLLDRLNMIEEIAAADQRRLAELNKAAEAVSTAKNTLEAKRAALEVSKLELSASQEVLEVKREEANALLTALIATGAEFEALLDAAEQDVENLLDEISQKEIEYDEAKDREYQQWLSTSIPPTTKPPVYTGGTAGSGNTIGGITLLVPCTYTRFSSPYGYRVHPVYGDWRFHSGVDLAAPSGTPIIATRSGRVSVADYSWSGGYYVSVDHLDGYVSKYLHMTHYIVSPGQYVTAGQVIGYVGSTGTSTGPHLHFSIYYNGSSVNPANYINI